MQNKYFVAALVPGKLGQACQFSFVEDARGFFTAPVKADEAWDQVLGVNLKGVFLCMKHAARRMRAQGQGGVHQPVGGAQREPPSAEGRSGGSAPDHCQERRGRVRPQGDGVLKRGHGVPGKLARNWLQACVAVAPKLGSPVGGVCVAAGVGVP